MISAALGTQVIGSTIRPASYCGCIGFKPSVGALNRGGSYDGLSQSCDRRARGDAGRRLAGRLRDRAARRRRSRLSRLCGPASAPAAQKPRRLAFLETAGWATASADAKQAMGERWRGSGAPASRC